MNNLFQALAHEARRTIIDLLVKEPGMTLNDLCEHFDFSRIALMKHLDSLKRGKLLISIKEGRCNRLYFNPVPIQQINDRWTSAFSRLWAQRLTEFKYSIENEETSACQDNESDTFFQ